jgi:DnaJ like chaperone protein
MDPLERTRTAFFAATFAVMGHIAKADGRVSEDEIRIARSAMDRMELDPGLRRLAQDLFGQGKRPEFPLDAVLQQLRRQCHRRRDLLRLFLEVQVEAALADGELRPEEQRLLERIARQLGFSRPELDAVLAGLRAEASFRGGFREETSRPGTGPGLPQAYAVLGIEPTADDAAVTRAYRRLMSQHHPDKLVSKGLPEEMIQLATRRTQEIKAAYERVKAERGL